MIRSDLVQIGIAVVLLLAATGLGLMWMTEPNMSGTDKVMFFTALAGAATTFSLIWRRHRR